MVGRHTTYTHAVGVAWCVCLSLCNFIIPHYPALVSSYFNDRYKRTFVLVLFHKQSTSGTRTNKHAHTHARAGEYLHISTPTITHLHLSLFPVVPSSTTHLPTTQVSSRIHRRPPFIQTSTSSVKCTPNVQIDLPFSYGADLPHECTDRHVTSYSLLPSCTPKYKR